MISQYNSFDTTPALALFGSFILLQLTSVEDRNKNYSRNRIRCMSYFFLLRTNLRYYQNLSL